MWGRCQAAPHDTSAFLILWPLIVGLGLGLGLGLGRGLAHGPFRV